MDMAGFKATLEKYGKDNCYMIMFDNSHACRIKELNEDKTFKKFDEVVTLDEENELIIFKQELQVINKQQCKEPLVVTVVKPVETVQGLFFASEYTRKHIDYAIESAMR